MRFIQFLLIASLANLVTANAAQPTAIGPIGPIGPIGLSGSGAHIQASQFAPPSSTRTVLLIGGLAGNDASVASVRNEAQAFAKLAKRNSNVALVVIPLANPDGAKLTFPATGVAYRENIESNVLWRWIQAHAPDLVMISGDDFGLVEALSNPSATQVGKIPAQRWSNPGDIAKTIAAGIDESEAHRELNRRLARSPRDLAIELANYYGRDFEQPLYIQSLALIARLRLNHLREVQQLGMRA
jgi:murein tripeptide amidase MpaA